MIDKIRNSYTRLVLLMVAGIVAGLHLMISPETVQPLIIQALGILWVMGGLSEGLSIIKKYKKNNNNPF